MSVCRFKGCKREALKGWTMCAAHRSAGMDMKHWKRMQSK